MKVYCVMESEITSYNDGLIAIFATNKRAEEYAKSDSDFYVIERDVIE